MAAAGERNLNMLAAAGLAAGAVFGLAGTFVESAGTRQLLWTIDGVGLIVAAALLIVKFIRRGNDLSAAGFLVFALGEVSIVSGNAAGLEASVPSFAGGAALWAAALLLISATRTFSSWTRIAGVVAAILFAIVSVRMVMGQELVPTSEPLPFFAYPFLVLTFIGWIWTLLRETKT